MTYVQNPDFQQLLDLIKNLPMGIAGDQEAVKQVRAQVQQIRLELDRSDARLDLVTKELGLE